MELDEDGSLRVLDAETWRARLRAGPQPAPFTHPEDLGPSPREAVVARHRREAERAAARGQWFAAAFHWDYVIAARPAEWRPHAGRAQAHRGLGHWDRAVADYEKALALGAGWEPERASELGDCYRRWGETQRKQGEGKRAEESYRKAVGLFDTLAKKHPLVAEHPAADYWVKLAHSYWQLGWLLVAERRFPEAEKSFREALKVFEELQARFHPGREGWYRQEWAEGHMYLGRLLEAAGRPGEAEQAYRQAASLYQKLAVDFPEMPEYRVRRGNSQNALAWLYATGPTGVRAPDKALPLARQAVQSAPKNRSFCRTLGVVYYRLGQFTEAKETIRRGLEDHRAQGTAHELFFLAMSHYRLGERDKARDCYERAVRWQKQAQLSGAQVEELNAFRAEALALMGENRER
jgi:tetratricopeptide (TPR) repeat protein